MHFDHKKKRKNKKKAKDRKIKTGVIFAVPKKFHHIDAILCESKYIQK